LFGDWIGCIPNHHGRFHPTIAARWVDIDRIPLRLIKLGKGYSTINSAFPISDLIGAQSWN
jgi:hypothetical protein